MAVLGHANESNPCGIFHMAWAQGAWRLPLIAEPPSTFLKNYPSIHACPQTLEAPLAEMLSILSPRSSFNKGDEPRLVHPLLAIVRANDLLKAHKSLENMRMPFSGAL